jgi:hypothetical protein
VGLFDQVPFETVSVLPTFAVPLTTGEAVLAGAVADAIDARNSPATSVPSSAGRRRFLISCPFRS